MRVLVAGDRGYIGAVLVPFLRAAGHEVDGWDVGLYEGCDLGPALPDAGTTSDARHAERHGRGPRWIRRSALPGCTLQRPARRPQPRGDVLGEPRWDTCSWHAPPSRRASSASCSPHPAAFTAPRGRAAVAEDAELSPVTPYGETKVAAERELSLLADDNFSPVYLRNATAYGASTRLRLDIVVNNLTAVALTTGQVRLRKRRHAVAAARAHRGHQPGVPRHAGGTPRARPRSGLQRRTRPGQRTGP